MSKLLSVLVAAFFAAGAFAQTHSTAPASGSLAGAGSASGSLSTSGSASNATSANTNTNNNTSLNANSNTNTNTNNVNVYGPGSNKLARQQRGSGGTGVSMMPGGGHGDRTARSGGDRSTRTGDSARRSGEQHASNSRWCPPGLAKKDNGCMPPGLAKQDRSPTSVMGNRGDDRDHDRTSSRHHHTHDRTTHR